ncbi:hypothetical protein AAH678_30175 [Sodalis endosymbiont of Spalangia cameroni]|uniref:hypothetical protein n=1 Tax=Sodalis praecaptivus TaxID=1239307 RepID=UPI0031F9096D
MVNFTTGEWIVKVLELLEKSTILRRMYYTAICCAFCYVVVKALPGVAAILQAIR